MQGRWRLVVTMALGYAWGVEQSGSGAESRERKAADRRMVGLWGGGSRHGFGANVAGAASLMWGASKATANGPANDLPTVDCLQMSQESESEWYVYVVRCDDGTLYTGITTDLERRIYEHNNTRAGAAYTRARRPVELVASWPHEDQSAAASAEAAFKSLSRDEKLERVESDLMKASDDVQPCD